MKKMIEIFSVSSAVFLVYLVQNSEVSKYQSPLLAIIIIFSAIYFSYKAKSETQNRLFTGNPVEIFLITTIVVFIIALTNGLFSTIFFFLYFIFFFLAFMASSISVFAFLVSMLIFFLPQTLNELTIDTFIRLGSLVLIAPIAYFVGSEFERRGITNKHINSKSNEIIDDAKNLKSTLDNPEEIEALDEIIDEATTLKKEINK